MVCVDTELAGLMAVVFDGRMLMGLVVGCFTWTFSVVGRGLPSCCIVPWAARVGAGIYIFFSCELSFFNYAFNSISAFEFVICFQFCNFQLTILLSLNRSSLRALLDEHPRTRASIWLRSSDEDGIWC